MCIFYIELFEPKAEDSVKKHPRTEIQLDTRLFKCTSFKLKILSFYSYVLLNTTVTPKVSFKVHFYKKILNVL